MTYIQNVRTMQAKKPETFAPKPGSEHTVLLLLVVDHILLLAVDPVLCQNSAQPASTKELRLSKSGSNSSTRTGYTAGANI